MATAMVTATATATATAMATLAADAASFVDDTALPGADYTYRVRAIRAGLFSLPDTAVAQMPAARVTEAVVASYTFADGTGDTVSDVSGLLPALDLTINETANVLWQADPGLSSSSIPPSPRRPPAPRS
jgi:protein-disulfide isomerase